MLLLPTLLALSVPFASAHYFFSVLTINGTTTPEWVNVRKTNNYYSHGPVTDVSSIDFRCYTSETNAKATKIAVSAGSQMEFGVEPGRTISHPSTTNIYMAKAPGDVSSWDGSGNVWFKVHEVSAITNGGSSISFPSEGMAAIPFTIPRNLPSGQYLVRIENVALHSAGSFGGAQFYIACGELEVVNGGSGNPGPLVAFPGAYTGREPGILINIYWPIPTSYTNPGPAIWRG